MRVKIYNPLDHDHMALNQNAYNFSFMTVQRLGIVAFFTVWAMSHAVLADENVNSRTGGSCAQYSDKMDMRSKREACLSSQHRLRVQAGVLSGTARLESTPNFSSDAYESGFHPASTIAASAHRYIRAPNDDVIHR